MRKIVFANGEHYHIFNRGVDKREIFLDEEDYLRFLQSMNEFNDINPIGSIFEKSFSRALGGPTAKPLVDFVCYCLNPNHFHFILRQHVDNGISEFMKRLGGYTWYFNNKYKRSGSLFQGKFKSIHINSNEYLLHLSAYVNLNDKVHAPLGGPAAKFNKSSWNEYVGENFGDYHFCEKEIILSQFNSNLEYKNFAESSLEYIRNKRGVEKFLLEK